MTPRLKGILWIATSSLLTWATAYVWTELVPPLDYQWWTIPALLHFLGVLIIIVLSFTNGLSWLMDGRPISLGA